MNTLKTIVRLAFDGILFYSYFNCTDNTELAG